jgi:hypothetical protein
MHARTQGVRGLMRVSACRPSGSFYYSKFVSAPKKAGSAARGKKLK